MRQQRELPTQPYMHVAVFSCRATKKQGGSTKNKKGSQPKYLGTKMSNGQLAFPGQIVVKQRGTNFHPGHNVGVVSRSSKQCIPAGRTWVIHNHW